MSGTGVKTTALSPADAQKAADRIRMLREELRDPEIGAVLALTAEQSGRFDEWAASALAALAGQFDIDATASQKRMSWGMRIASTLGAIAISTAVVLFFLRFWGYLETWVQVAVVFAAPLAALAATEFISRRERSRYFTGLMALVALACFLLNLQVLGYVFNIAATENALLAWGLFGILMAYRYGLRLMLFLSLCLLLSWGAAFFAARLGYHWMDFGDRPEVTALLGAAVFAIPMVLRHERNTDFPAVFRLAGSLVFFISVLSLAEWGRYSFFPAETKTVEMVYEFIGLGAAAAAIWTGIVRDWPGTVNTASVFFAIFLFCRLYHWLWEWMPKYLFFAIVGLVGIGLVAALKRLRMRSYKEAGV
jgi:uncharacterized membrane protein